MFYADDGFALERNVNKEVLARKTKLKLEKTIKWLMQSGMKVNEAKTAN